jgi:ubiquinone/menaquinone biosynthesis C-methylase UbiE
MDKKAMVETEALLWGDDVGDKYHAAAEGSMNPQWANIIWPILAGHGADLARSIDFACGRGRNTRKLLESGAGEVTLVDVQPDNTTYCEQRFRGQPIKSVVNNGLDLAGIDSDSHTLVYSWDAMVHFDPLIVGGYLPEFARVLKPGGTCFIHHSNYSAAPGGDFRHNPHWRNYMTADLFKHFAVHSGFEVLEQKLLDWVESKNIDCITVLRTRA